MSPYNNQALNNNILNTNLVISQNFNQNKIKQSVGSIGDDLNSSMLNKKVGRSEPDDQFTSTDTKEQKSIKKSRMSNEVQEYTVPLNYVQKQLKLAQQVSIVKIISDNINENCYFQKYV